jgi:hypothetical protein
VRNDKGDITTNTNEILSITENILKTYYPKNLENVEEMDTFIGGYDLLTFNQEDINQIFNEQ